ncbi:MAG TPA: hypothetical protein VHQ86_00230 [Candidatus Saccharimonadia bacterium]|jgi:ribulose-phosphate 3-epimerase|nr:hypothetical protein [Candidatus Saccharimonadia bacterium]
MASVAPTILSTTAEDYARRINNVKGFAQRLHIDVGDGVFSPVKSLDLSQVYDIDGVPFDLHLMMNHPESALEDISALQPQLVITHFEAQSDHEAFFKSLREMDIKVGLAVLVETTIDQVESLLPNVDHLLIFTGKLGHNGGEFRADCMEKIAQARAINPDLEIGVDGGINQETAHLVVDAGANVLDVGSFIHDADDPEIAYIAIQAIAEGTS